MEKRQRENESRRRGDGKKFLKYKNIEESLGQRN